MSILESFTPEQLAALTVEQIQAFTASDVALAAATPAKLAYPAVVSNFNLITSTNSINPKAPNYFGSFKLHGKWYSVSSWNQTSKTGQPIINNSIRPCTDEETEKNETREAAFQSNRPNTTVNPLAAEIKAKEEETIVITPTKAALDAVEDAPF